MMITALLGTSCSTTYDTAGKPRKTVDPGLAVAGVAAAALIGYNVSKNRHKDDGYRYDDRNHYDYNRYENRRRSNTDYRRNRYRDTYRSY